MRNFDQPTQAEFDLANSILMFIGDGFDIDLATIEEIYIDPKAEDCSYIVVRNAKTKIPLTMLKQSYDYVSYGESFLAPLLNGDFEIDRLIKKLKLKRVHSGPNGSMLNQMKGRIYK